jgi:hypothetical protein
MAEESVLILSLSKDAKRRSHAARGGREAMSGTVDALILDLLEWVASGERSYADVMDAWRTSCPRLPVWEEANERGLVARQHVDGRSVVRPTASGLALLERRAIRQVEVPGSDGHAGESRRP